jgi:hypothetical protein
MDSLCVVESFDVLEHAESCLGDAVEGFELLPLMLERPEETFHDNVVEAAIRVMLDWGDSSSRSR